MEPKQISRKHLGHQHQMNISVPQRDRRELYIPNDTFDELERPTFSLPFRYLRTWFFSLLALIALPIGLMLVLLGAKLQDSDINWRELSATVTQANEDGIHYEIDSLGSKSSSAMFNFALDQFTTVSDDSVALHMTICDLASRFIVPQERGASFSVWVNPDDATQQSCVPIGYSSGEMYFTIGMIILLLSAWRLVRTIHAAGLQPKRT